MLWFFLALLSILLWSFSSMFDKILVSNYTKNPLIATTLNQMASLAMLLVIAFFAGFTVPKAEWLFLLFVSTLLNMTAVLLYFKAMHTAEMSRVLTAINIMPFFVLLIAVVFLGEKVSFLQTIGIFLIVSGALLVSQRKELKLNGWFFVIILSAALFSIDTVMQKFLLREMSIIELIEWRIVFLLICFSFVSLPFLKKIKKIVVEKPKSLALATASSVFFISGRISFITAISLGLVSLVAAVQAVQPFMILGLALIFTKFMPHLIKEEISRKTIALKILAVCLVVIGSVMLL